MRKSPLAIKHATSTSLMPWVPGFHAAGVAAPIAAKLRIDMAIIFRVVLMDARRGKYRIQI